MCLPKFINLIDYDFSKKGFDITKLKPGTKIYVTTVNNLYTITIIDGCKVKVKGGKYFPDEQEKIFNGSTWGGSMIKLNWIGYDMCMEFGNQLYFVLTSPVQTAIILGDDWYYELSWNTELDSTSKS